MKLFSCFCLFICTSTFNSSAVSYSSAILSKKQEICQQTKLNSTINVDLNNLMQFNSSYLTNYTNSPKQILLTATFNTNQLNTSNQFTFASIDGELTNQGTFKTIYHFPIYLSNNETSQFFNLKNLSYSNLSASTISLSRLVSFSDFLSKFSTNFLQDNWCKVPTVFAKCCNNLTSPILSSLNINNLPNGVFDFPFQHYEQAKLFLVPSLNSKLQQLNNLSLNVYSNALFKTISLVKLNKNLTIQTTAQPIARYFVNDENIVNGNFPIYSQAVPISLNINLQNLQNYVYVFNPNFLVKVIHQPTYLNHNAPYLTYPTLSFGLNPNLVKYLYIANITALMVQDLVAVFSNNAVLIQLLYYDWTNHFFSFNLMNQICNLLGADWNYVSNTNNLSWMINEKNAENLLNILKNNLHNQTHSVWSVQLSQMMQTSYNLSMDQTIALYQTLLSTYQNSKLQLNFAKNNPFTFNNLNCSLSLGKVTPLSKTTPYELTYCLNNIALTSFNITTTLQWNSVLNQTWKTNSWTFGFLLYPSYNQINLNNNVLINHNKQQILLLQKPNNMNQVWVNDLSNQFNLSATTILNQLNQFNQSITLNLTSALNQDFFIFDFLQTMNTWFDLSSNLLTYLQQNYYNNDIFVNNNNSLIQLEKENQQNNQVNVTFNLTTQLYFTKNTFSNNDVPSNNYFNTYQVTLYWTLPTKQISDSHNTNTASSNAKKIKNNENNNTKNNSNPSLNKPASTKQNSVLPAKKNMTPWWAWIILVIVFVLILVIAIWMIKHIAYKQKQIKKYKQEEGENNE